MNTKIKGIKVYNRSKNDIEFGRIGEDIDLETELVLLIKDWLRSKFPEYDTAIKQTKAGFN